MSKLPEWFVKAWDMLRSAPMEFVQVYAGELLLGGLFLFCCGVLLVLARSSRAGSEVKSVGELEMSGYKRKSASHMRRVEVRRIVADELEEMFLKLVTRPKDTLTAVEAEAWKQRIGKHCGIWDLLYQTLPATPEVTKDRLTTERTKRHLNGGGTPSPIPDGPKTASDALRIALHR